MELWMQVQRSSSEGRRFILPDLCTRTTSLAQHQDGVGACVSISGAYIIVSTLLCLAYTVAQP
ncbi:unnamed protein product [Clonostachys rosea f. rosea IK726]|uniref:Uncharacterized protein n=1 Tax=Clonostachys rosea f. rosea IK726 TaxID=1349383 RepID=A0ACA9TWK5_BIOOC|nr:unnamed protein product [Clonostachys rosea f. rosea IK726]